MAEKSGIRHILIWTLKIVVSTGLLYLVLSRVDLARLWTMARTASIPWLASALLLYFVMILISAWRWDILLRAQHLAIAFGQLVNSFLVATFFNNFLPSNIGGDVVRIRDSSRAAGSKTLAATIVLADRGIGLLGLIFVAALGATIAARMSEAIGPLGPGVLWLLFAGAMTVATPVFLFPHRVGQVLRPLRALHQEWVEERITRLTGALSRFRETPGALLTCFGGAILVQAVLVGFYAAIAVALGLHIHIAYLAVIVPVSFIVQMAPVSVNGFGVREWTWVFYFRQIGLPAEQAVALSFIGAALIILFSTTGAAAYLSRKNQAPAEA